MQKDKIQITLTTSDGQRVLMEKEVDIAQMKHVDIMEEQFNKITNKAMVFLMKQGIKKKKQWRWKLFYFRIQALFAMGPLSSRSLVRRSASSSKGKSLASK